MMPVIHKQQLTEHVLQFFRPTGEVLKLLDVQYQNGVPCIWYEIEPDRTADFYQREVHIQVVGTGHPCPAPPWAYIGTTQVHNGQTFNLVWHWYGKVVCL